VILQRKVSHTNMEVDVTITIEGAQPHENVIALIKHLPKSDAVDATVYLERHHGDPPEAHIWCPRSQEKHCFAQLLNCRPRQVDNAQGEKTSPHTKLFKHNDFRSSTSSHMSSTWCFLFSLVSHPLSEDCPHLWRSDFRAL